MRSLALDAALFSAASAQYSSLGAASECFASATANETALGQAKSHAPTRIIRTLDRINLAVLLALANHSRGCALVGCDSPKLIVGRSFLR